MVIDQETGLLCPQGEDVCLGTLSAALLNDQDRYQAMRRAARENAERFASGPIVERYEAALGRLITPAPVAC